MRRRSTTLFVRLTIPRSVTPDPKELQTPHRRPYDSGLRLGLAVANRLQSGWHAVFHKRRVRLTVVLVALVAADAHAQDSTAVRAGGLDGRRAAREISTKGSFAGGVASGLLGPFGLLIVLPVANRPVPTATIPGAARANDNQDYARAFSAAFTKEVRRRRRASAFLGNLVIFGPLMIVGSGYDDVHGRRQ